MAELTAKEVEDLRVGIKEYTDEKFRAQDEKLKAYQAVVDSRLDHMNEFRATMQDQTASYLPRSEYGVWQKKIDTEIQELRDFRSALNGKANQNQVNAAFAISAIGIILSTVSIIINLVR